MALKIIILDFDGVILESVSVKTEAFRTIFSFSPDNIDSIIQFHLENGGMSRFEKFHYIYEKILHKKLTPSTFQKLSDDFSELVYHEVIKAPFVPGACEFLRKYYTRFLLYVVSATPENELIAIIEKKGLTQYFQKIYGAPKKKAECIRQILLKNSVFPSDVIFIGDAKNDLAASKATNVRFIGRVSSDEPNRFNGCIGIERLVLDMHELDQYISENL
jgi:phosphoglycolate phosphatase-like HAD superfamily hydrolase